MTRRNFALVAAALFVAVGLAVTVAAARGATGTAASVAPAHAGLRHVTIESSWAHAYGDLHELKAGAIAVVLGTVMSGQQLATSSFGVNTPTKEFQIHVERTLKGSVPTTVAVQQIGGTTADGTTVVEVSDDPLLAAGERGIFFLFTSNGAFYTLLDGGMGHFTSANGIVDQRGAFAASPAFIRSGRQPAAPIHGVSEAAFVAQVLAA